MGAHLQATMAHAWYADAEWTAHVEHGHRLGYLGLPDEWGCVKCFLCSKNGTTCQDNGHFNGHRHQSRLTSAFGSLSTTDIILNVPP